MRWTSATRVGTYLWVLLAIVLLASCKSDKDRASGGGGDPSGAGGDGGAGGEPPITEVDPAPELTQEVDIGQFTTGSFIEVAAILDLDGSGRIDQDDYAQLKAAVADVDADQRPEADLVPDGVLDEKDTRLFQILVGTVSPRTEAQILRLADEIDQFANGEFDADLTPLAIDYDEDGDNDADDMHFLANALRGDPVGRFDFDNSGALTFNDVSIAAHLLEAATDTTDLSAYDATGNGTTDDLDLMLIAELAVDTCDFTIGLIDYNADGAVDWSDYCVVTEGPDQPNFYRLFMPDAEADAAFAEAPHVCAVCRADGASYLTYPLDFATELKVVILPENLYLVSVDQLPSGYDPVGDPPAADAPLYVVGTNGSEFPITSISLPHDPPPSGVPSTNLQVGGSGLPANAVVATPEAFIETGPDVSDSAPSGPTGPAPGQSRHTIEFIERLLERDERAQAKAFETALNQALAKYETYINNVCPCDSQPQQRAQLVRELIRMSNCLKAVEATAQKALEDSEQNHRQTTRAHQLRGRLAALGWYQLSETVVEMEWVSTIMLVLDTLHTGATQGLPAAFAGALNNLASEMVSDATKADFFDVNAPGSPVGDMLNGMAVSNAAGMVTNPVAETLQQMMTRGGSPLTPRKFTRELIGGVGEHFGKYQAPGLQDFIKSMIKLIPVLYVDYVKRMAFARESQASDAAYQYYQSTLTVGGWKKLVKTMISARARLDDSLIRLLAAFAAHLCGMQTSVYDACMPALAAAIETAGTNLSNSVADANRQIDEALAGLGRGDAAYECFRGSNRTDVDKAEAELKDVAHQMTKFVAEGNARGAAQQLGNEIRDLNQQRRTRRESWSAECVAEILGGNANDEAKWQALANAMRAKQQAFDDYESALGAALSAYITCSSDGGGACAATVGLQGSPWVAATACLQCVPDIQWDCATPPSRTADWQTLGDDLHLDPGSVDGGYQDLTVDTCVHSSDLIGSKPVAGDHTTLDGYLYLTHTYTGVDLSSLFPDTFPCGASGADFTLCPSGAQVTPPPGDYEILIMDTQGTIPTSDPTNSYQYGFVFDSNGDPIDNYAASPSFPNDFFDNTDLWYRVSYEPGTGWSLTLTDAAYGTTTAIGTEARAVIRDSAMALLFPSSELAVAPAPHRVTDMGYTGNWGMDPGDVYDCSLYPSVADGLATLP